MGEQHSKTNVYGARDEGILPNVESTNFEFIGGQLCYVTSEVRGCRTVQSVIVASGIHDLCVAYKKLRMNIMMNSERLTGARFRGSFKGSEDYVS